MGCTNFFLLYLILVLSIFSANDGHNSVYEVHRLETPVEINGEWDKEAWKNIPEIQISKYMGDEPDYIPQVQAKIGYDQEAVYVIFKVEDRYVRCAVEEYQGPVSRDSCVEFFFTPGRDISNGYFNVEINCGGTALFAFQKKRGEGRRYITKSEFSQVELAHSLPQIVNPEIRGPVTWTIEYRIPIRILKKYTDVTRPAPGEEWRANLYKIASTTSNPHYLTWSFVDYPEPQFHLPQYFGTLKFQ